MTLFRPALAAAFLAAAALFLPPSAPARALHDIDHTVILVAGDSRVANGFTNPTHDFPARLGQHFCGLHCPAGAVKTIAAGGGSLISQRCGGGHAPLVAVWEQALDAAPKPTTAIVQVGINDLYCQGAEYWTLDDMLQAYHWLEITGTQHGVNVLISTIIPTTADSTWRGHTEPARQMINQWLRDVLGPAHVVDFSAILSAPWGPVLDAPYVRDALHPNEWGVVRMCDMIRNDQAV